MFNKNFINGNQVESILRRKFVNAKRTIVVKSGEDLWDLAHEAGFDTERFFSVRDEGLDGDTFNKKFVVRGRLRNVSTEIIDEILKNENEAKIDELNQIKKIQGEIRKLERAKVKLQKQMADVKPRVMNF